MACVVGFWQGVLINSAEGPCRGSCAWHAVLKKYCPASRQAAYPLLTPCTIQLSVCVGIVMAVGRLLRWWLGVCGGITLQFLTVGPFLLVPSYCQRGGGARTGFVCAYVLSDGLVYG